jgi:hypothetical protein
MVTLRNTFKQNSFSISPQKRHPVPPSFWRHRAAKTEAKVAKITRLTVGSSSVAEVVGADVGSPG